MIATISALVLALVRAITPHAEAECAWVLWSEILVPAKSTPTRWSIADTYETRAQCQIGLTNRLEDTKSYEGIATKTRVIGSPSFLLKWSNNPDVLMVTFSCVPDTIDPRGAKGGGR